MIRADLPQFNGNTAETGYASRSISSSAANPHLKRKRHWMWRRL
jgi:hypothetical protein